MEYIYISLRLVVYRGEGEEQYSLGLSYGSCFCDVPEYVDLFHWLHVCLVLGSSLPKTGLVQELHTCSS